MFRFFLWVLLPLIITGCTGPRYVDYFPYRDDGTSKPKVVILPIIDSSNSELTWDMSQELYEGIYYELMNSGEFYVPTSNEIGPAWESRHEINAFQVDMIGINNFSNADFIVGMEIVEHSVSQPLLEQPKHLIGSCPMNRSMLFRVRLKIIDVRCANPKVILYEIFKTCYTLSPSTCAVNCNDVPLGMPGYGKSPCGLAHRRLVSNLTARIEEVIWSHR